jgi:hypothetical protein
MEDTAVEVPEEDIVVDTDTAARSALLIPNQLP